MHQASQLPPGDATGKRISEGGHRANRISRNWAVCKAPERPEMSKLCRSLSEPLIGLWVGHNNSQTPTPQRLAAGHLALRAAAGAALPHHLAAHRRAGARVAALRAAVPPARQQPAMKHSMSPLGETTRDTPGVLQMQRRLLAARRAKLGAAVVICKLPAGSLQAPHDQGNADDLQHKSLSSAHLSHVPPHGGATASQARSRFSTCMTGFMLSQAKQCNTAAWPTKCRTAWMHLKQAHTAQTAQQASLPALHHVYSNAVSAHLAAGACARALVGARAALPGLMAGPRAAVPPAGQQLPAHAPAAQRPLAARHRPRLRAALRAGCRQAFGI